MLEAIFPVPTSGKMPEEGLSVEGYYMRPCKIQHLSFRRSRRGMIGRTFGRVHDSGEGDRLLWQIFAN